MRHALTGRASVLSVRPNTSIEPDPRWNRGATFGATAGPSSGGSFLSTAAASAAGVIGGALLLNSISSMFGHHGGSAFAAAPLTGSPWDSSAGSDLSRDAGLNDIGNGARGDTPPAGLFDSDETGDASDLGDDFGSDVGGDFGGGDSA
jgi:uncharacterized protein